MYVAANEHGKGSVQQVRWNRREVRASPQSSQQTLETSWAVIKTPVGWVV